MSAFLTLLGALILMGIVSVLYASVAPLFRNAYEAKRSVPAEAAGGAVDSALYLCRLVDSAKLASSPCEVSGPKATVTVSLDVSSFEARKTCNQLAEQMRSLHRTFDARWTLEITSPHSNGQTIAYCRLR